MEHIHKKTKNAEIFMLYTEDSSVFIFIRLYLICFLVKTAFAIPLKKGRKRKNNVFLRGNCFRFIRFLCDSITEEEKGMVYTGYR